MLNMQFSVVRIIWSEWLLTKMLPGLTLFTVNLKKSPFDEKTFRET